MTVARRVWQAVLLALAVGWASVVMAEGPGEVDEGVIAAVTGANAVANAGAGAAATLAPGAFTVGDDPAVVAAMQAALVAQFDYAATTFAHRRATFNWQLWSGYITFGVVIGIVMIGLYFSWLQFSDYRQHTLALRRRAGTGATAAEPNPSEMQSTLEFGTGGIKVSSPVLGVVILVISVAFFYLYLVHIYPISAIDSAIGTDLGLLD